MADKTEGPHIERLLRIQPSIQRGKFKKALTAVLEPSAERLAEYDEPDGTPEDNALLCEGQDTLEVTLARFKRLPDAYEFTPQGLVLYEVDGTHITTRDKFCDIIALAEDLAWNEYVRLPVGLFIYDVRSDQSRWWSAHALLGLSAVDFDRTYIRNNAEALEHSYPARLQCSRRGAGLDLSIIDWERVFTHYGEDVVLPTDFVQATGYIGPPVVTHGAHLDTLCAGILRDKELV